MSRWPKRKIFRVGELGIMVDQRGDKPSLFMDVKKTKNPVFGGTEGLVFDLANGPKITSLSTVSLNYAGLSNVPS
ncbi:MAG: hypothetical protein KAQ83_04960, partial [Nanoarchaeota archaeon]|nr:hypothetical protein [Nanoarchaeota archaeon]